MTVAAAADDHLLPMTAGHGGSSPSCEGHYSVTAMCQDLQSFVLEQQLYTAPFALVSFTST